MAKSQTDFVNFRTKGNICNLSFSKHFLCLPLILKTFYFTAITIFVLVLEGTLVLPLLFFLIIFLVSLLILLRMCNFSTNFIDSST